MIARIRLCGRLEVELGGERVEHRLPGRQGPLVLAVLAVNRERPVSRDELIGALWPNRPPSDPDEALSALLSKVRLAVGREVLPGRRELTLSLPGGAEIDIEQAHGAAERARVALAAGDWAAAWEAASTAADVAGRGFMVGHGAPWVQERRAELEELRLRALAVRAQTGLALGGGHADGAERAAAELVREAPLREAGHRLLMEALAARGEVAEALAAYERLRVLLRDELGTAPGEAVRALHQRLLTGDAPAPPPSRVPAPDRLPERLAQSRASAWVGRHAILRRLRERAEHAAAGETGLVLVSGEGGIGKTRILAELAHRMPAFEVLYGRCDEEELFPFGPWIDMLRPQLARMPQPELSELVSGAPELARLLPEIHERLPDLAGLPPVGEPETRRRQMFGAVVAVVRRLAADGPVLMIVDDLHWADRSSLLLARHVAKEPRLGAVLMVGTFRDTELQPGHPLPELLAELERGRELPRIRLDGMDEREVAQLIGGDAAPGTVSAIHAETGGNPFFVKQLARHLEELDGARIADAGVPQGVRDVIAARVGRLSEHAGSVLGVAALIGRDFDLELLERVAGLPEDELLDVLDAAVRGALLAEVPSTPGRYSFAHALLRTTLEAELSATRRARLHLRIGEAIEQVHGARPDPWLAELARHFCAAGPRAADRAVAYAERAAAQAASRLAYDEAVRLLEAAARLRRDAEHVDQAGLARLENALAAAQADAGQWEAARASFARAAVAARSAGAAPAFARAALGHAGGTWEQYGVEDAENVALLEEALRRLPTDDSPMRAQVLARIAVHRHFVAQVPEADVRATADEAVTMARRLGEPQPLAAALAGALHARWRPGRAADRLELAAELIELTEAHAAITCAADAHIWRAGALLELCRLDEADAHLARQAELAEASQQPALLIHRDAMRSMRAALEGDYERGARIAHEMFERGEREEADGRLLTPIHAQFHGTNTLSLLNERGELAPHAPLFERLARQIAAPGWRPALAWAHAQAGRPEHARELIEAMSDGGFASTPRDSNFVARLAQVAHVVAELGDAELAARVEPLLASYGDFWVVLGPSASTLGPVAYSVGAMRLLQDRPAEAAASFERAIERSRAMRARPYEARSQAGLAAALRRVGENARAAEPAARAAVTARELGMVRLQRELALASPAR
ncbi:MAG TPA: AAA family ATPase [Solirubrobacteraceae bacterium]|nr:AAA family ATPase [Solirubrobacteraceae bacterium]